MRIPFKVETLQKVVTSTVVGAALMSGTISGLVQIRQRNLRRKKWLVPITVLVLIIIAGLIGATVERVVDSQPQLQCLNGTYAGTDGKLTCRAVLATSIPAGASARCNDNTYSFNRSSASLCSRHGGVQAALK